MLIAGDVSKGWETYQSCPPPHRDPAHFTFVRAEFPPIDLQPAPEPPLLGVWRTSRHRYHHAVALNDPGGGGRGVNKSNKA